MILTKELQAWRNENVKGEWEGSNLQLLKFLEAYVLKRCHLS